MHGRFREIKAAAGACGRAVEWSAVGWIWFRLQFVASLSPIDHLLTCGLATFHEVTSKPLTIDNGRTDNVSGI